MIEAYITLAQHPIRREDRGEKKLPPELRKRKLADLTSVPVVTCRLAVDHSCQYPKGSFPYFRSFEDRIQDVGGINVPKVRGRLYTPSARSFVARLVG